jgi:hypothetical protein
MENMENIDILSNLPDYCYIYGECAQRLYLKKKVEVYEIAIICETQDFEKYFKDCWNTICELHKPIYTNENISDKLISSDIYIRFLKRNFKNIKKLIYFQKHIPYEIIISKTGEVYKSNEFTQFCETKTYQFNLNSIIAPNIKHNVMINLEDGNYECELYEKITIKNNKITYVRIRDTDNVKEFIATDKIGRVLYNLYSMGDRSIVLFNSIIVAARHKTIERDCLSGDFSQVILSNGNLPLKLENSELKNKIIAYVTQLNVKTPKCTQHLQPI